MGLTEIASIGAKYMENWLNQNGYIDLEIDNWQAGSVDIKAKGIVENILVQVRTILLPGAMTPVSGTDKFALKDLATRLDRIPYIAFISVDENDSMIGEIVWERLY